LLDVLGIKYIFAELNEPVPSSLLPSALLPAENGRIIVMYTNPNAWPDAVIISNETASLQPSLEGGQDDKGLLFYDFRPLFNMRIMEDAVTTKRDHGSITLMLEPSSKKRIAMVSEYFRSGWKAKGMFSENLIETKVFPLYGQLLGVEIPSGITEVRLSYHPVFKTIVLPIALGVLIFSTFGALGIWLWSMRAFCNSNFQNREIRSQALYKHE
jgi:hypothetical protein